MHLVPRYLRTRALPAVLLPALLFAGCGDRDVTAVAAAAGPSLAMGIARSGSSDLVISQVYGGGGNTGAPFRNKFVELFNRGGGSLPLDGLSIQYASATGSGNFANPVALSGTLEAGQYLLVQVGPTGTCGNPPSGACAPLPDPDIVGGAGFNPAAASGKVIVANTTTAIACNGGSSPCSPEQLALIVDLVGYGNANFFEGSGAAATLNNTTAAFRLNGGCRDTDDNAADFATGAPSPRNRGEAPNPCPVAPEVTATVPADGATGVPLDADIRITFSEPVNVSGEWFAITCTTSGARTATAGGGPTTFTLDVDGAFAASESCTVTVFASGVTDQGDPPVNMAEDYRWSFTTLDLAVCEQPFTPIYEIQGRGPSTPIPGQTVTTQGVVVGEYQGPAPTLGGFYLQDLRGDGDPETSDGIFVFNRGREGQAPGLAVGDRVRVTGRATEFQGQTQIDNVTATVVCGGGYTIAPTDVTLPFPAPAEAYLERYEGMLVRLPQTLQVTEHYFLGRFGAIVMSAGGRLWQPTQVVLPGAPAAAVQAANDRNRIVIDDELNNQNPDPIRFGRGGEPLSASNTLRGGDQAAGIVGVMTYTWAGAAASGNAFRLRPVGAMGGGVPNFQPANPRPNSPAPVGGTLRAASFNVYNYFNSFSGCRGGVGGVPMDCRGARNAQEFERQWRKTVAAITTMDADVIGVMEMENDGYGPESAIADLVSRLNAATAPGTYAFIDADAATGQVNALGTDAIKNGLIYKPARVTPVGATAVLNSDAFVTGGDSGPRNRPSLTQAFQQPGGGRFVANVNHLKSKGSACDVPDQGDGQGNCNLVRLNAANLLRQWLATDPTGTGDPDVLILGDLNSYAREDPIRTLTDHGYTDVAASRSGFTTYSYVFDGQWGTLDYALASSSLDAQVTGVTKWHINADEPIVLDYSTQFKSPGQIQSLYAPDPFRSSDHDPVVVGLSLAASPPPCTPRAIDRIWSDGSPPGTVRLGDPTLFIASYDVESFLPRSAGASAVRFGPDWQSGTPAAAVALQDVNNDGRRDVVVSWTTATLIADGRLGVGSQEVRIRGRDPGTQEMFCAATQVTVVP